MAVFEQVKTIVAKELEADEAKVTSEAKFTDDLGADSLAIVELVMKLEEEFDMEIPEDEAENIKTVGQAVEYIEKHST